MTKTTDTTELADDGVDQARGAMSFERPEGQRTRVHAAAGRTRRPATGRSFLTMMVLVLAATSVALYLAMRSPSDRADHSAAEKLGGRHAAP
ncbi:MAG TPA: hypothetical protein VHG72_17000 [Polyangia bacterium]|nr:hypothetical protein [Polyangia bacterium]